MEHANEGAEALTRELLAWVGDRPRTYGETMEAWRTHCPRQAVWEETLAAGLIEVVKGSGTMEACLVVLTVKGKAQLDKPGRR